MAITEQIYQLLKADLTNERILLDQVANYIGDQYGFTTVQLDNFVQEKYPELEDYEIDLTFSPQFTPIERDRLQYIPILAAEALSEDDLKAIKRQLVAENLTTRLVTEDRLSSAELPLHEVIVDRWVGLLNLDQPLPDASILEAVKEFAPHSLPEVNLLARDEVWRSPDRQQVLIAFLKVFAQQRDFTVAKLHYLTDFVRTYRPSSLLDLGRQFQRLIDSCEADQEQVNGRGFADDFLKATHAGNRLNVSNESEVFERYQHMKDMALALQADWEQIERVCPEIWQQAVAQQPA